MDTRSSFSSICMLWISVCVGLHSGESVTPVSGEEGSTAVLPCELKSVGTETLHIKWKNEDEVVFEQKGTEAYQGEGYEGRVDVPEEELRKRNCSLVLSNLKFSDSGVYTSIQIIRRTKRAVYSEVISRVSLSVREKPPEEKSDEVPSPTDAAGMVRPQPLIMVSITALISCFLILLFWEEMIMTSSCLRTVFQSHNRIAFKTQKLHDALKKNSQFFSGNDQMIS